MKDSLMVTIRCFAYNHEPYIRQCLEGFVMQKTNFRFEAIVHDDASTDGTAAIIREYAEKYPEIIKPILQTENQYSKHDGSLRRIMDAHTHGKYIAICEGDDYWIDPLKLQKQVDFMEANLDYSLCFHNAIKLNNRSRAIERISSFNYFDNSRIIPTEELIAGWYIPTASILYRKSCLNKIEIPTYFSGDYTLQLVLAAIGKVSYIDEYMSVYRLVQGGVSNQISSKKWVKQLHDLLDWYDTFTEKKYSLHIKKREKDANNFSRYCILKNKSILLPFLVMPIYTFQRFCRWKNRLR